MKENSRENRIRYWIFKQTTICWKSTRKVSLKSPLWSNPPMVGFNMKNSYYVSKFRQNDGNTRSAILLPVEIYRQVAHISDYIRYNFNANNSRRSNRQKDYFARKDHWKPPPRRFEKYVFAPRNHSSVYVQHKPYGSYWPFKSKRLLITVIF